MKVEWWLPRVCTSSPDLPLDCISTLSILWQRTPCSLWRSWMAFFCESCSHWRSYTVLSRQLTRSSGNAGLKGVPLQCWDCPSCTHAHTFVQYITYIHTYTILTHVHTYMFDTDLPCPLCRLPTQVLHKVSLEGARPNYVCNTLSNTVLIYSLHRIHEAFKHSTVGFRIFNVIIHVIPLW